MLMSLQLLGVTNALEYLHGKNPPIYHGDVHPVRNLSTPLLKCDESDRNL